MIDYEAALEMVRNPARRAQVEVAATQRLPNTGKRCAATMHRWLQLWEVLPEGRLLTWTTDLLKQLKPLSLLVVRDIGAVRPLDLVVTLDRDNNDAPDHLGIPLSIPGPAPHHHVTFLDNQNHFEPYERNLGSGPKTPMDYALRIDWPEKPKVDVSDLECVEAFGTIYRYVKEREDEGFPQDTHRALNILRRLPGFPPIFRE